MEYFLLLGFGMILGGLLNVSAAVMDWDWVMSSYRSKLWVLMLGRDGARCLYFALGVLVMFAGCALIVFIETR